MQMSCSCIAEVSAAWLGTLLDVIDLLPTDIIKKDVSSFFLFVFQSLSFILSMNKGTSHDFDRSSSSDVFFCFPITLH